MNEMQTDLAIARLGIKTFDIQGPELKLPRSGATLADYREQGAILGASYAGWYLQKWRSAFPVVVSEGEFIGILERYGEHIALGMKASFGTSPEQWAAFCEAALTAINADMEEFNNEMDRDTAAMQTTLNRGQRRAMRIRTTSNAPRAHT